MTRPHDSDDRRAALGLMSVSRETEGDFAAYVALLQKWQRIKNLVGPGTLDQVWTRHIADSAQLAALATGARFWVDLGSGAGLPGLVIAILLKRQPGARVVLVEANARKCAFLREVSRTLELPAEVRNGRIEEVIPTLDRADVVTARALAPLPVLLRWSEKLLTRGAVGLFPKGQDVAAELTESAKYWRIDASVVPSVTNPEAGIVVVRQLEPANVSTANQTRAAAP